MSHGTPIPTHSNAYRSISMTIYYLMIKTHEKTGLKYLCQTKQNPFKYRGSGVDWTTHLSQYGNKVNTEIVFQTTDWDELTAAGRYWSKYYHVVAAVDDFGNKIWANKIPETGGGDGSHSENTIWIARCDRKKMIATELLTDYLLNGWSKGLPKSPTHDKVWIYNHNTDIYSLCDKTELEDKIASGWIKKKWAPVSGDKMKGSNNRAYDHNIYHWKNNIINIEEHLTQFDLRMKYQLDGSCLTRLIRRNQKSHQGWVLLSSQ